MKRIVPIFILLILLAIPTSAAMAQGDDDKVVAGGETIDDDLVIFSGDLDIDEGATVTGDVVMMSGNAHIAGTVEGDIVLFSGNMETTETADIQGDCVLFSGNFSDLSNNVSCTNVSSEFPAALRDLPDITRPRLNAPPIGEGDLRPSFLGNLLGAIGSSILLGILAFVVAAFAPRQLGRTREAVRTKTVVSGTVGLLTAVAIPSLIAILAPISAILILACGIGLLGFPIIIALAVGLAAGAIFGWVTIGSLFGQKMTQLLNINPANLPVVTALGTAVLTFGISMLDAIPFVPGEGFLAGLITCVGLGATALTHFGTKVYPRLSGPTLAGGPVENSDKFRAVFDTLPPEDPSDLK